MDEAEKALQKLDASTRRYRQTEKAHAKARDEAVADVVAALEAGARPTDVTARSPFSPAHVRSIARENGIAPAKKGRRQ